MKIKEIPHGFSFPSILCNSQWGGSSIFISRPQLDGSLATTWGRNHPQRGKRQIKCRGNGRWWLKRFPLKRIDLVFMLGCAVNIKKLIWIFREGKRFFVYSTVNTSTFETIGKHYKFQKWRSVNCFLTFAQKKVLKYTSSNFYLLARHLVSSAIFIWINSTVKPAQVPAIFYFSVMTF